MYGDDRSLLVGLWHRLRTADVDLHPEELIDP